MKKLIGILLLCSVCSAAHSQTVLSLDSCRAMALRNNKELRIAREKTKSAHYERKAAFTNYLPKLSATGAYLHNNKELSLLSDDQKTTLTNMGTGLATVVPALQALGVDQLLNSLGSTVVNGLRTDTRNVYAGAVTLTQPLFMGGKIRAYNQITRYAEQLSRAQENAGTQDIILSTDEAYWQVVSLANKKRLAESFLALVKQLDSDVDKMIREGVATKADGLSVKVKVNEAEMTLTKVADGLSLARMLLCQLCGLPLDSNPRLDDEETDDLPATATPPTRDIDMEAVYASRPEVRSLEIAARIYDQKVRVTRSDMLPSIALMGNYIATSPSVSGRQRSRTPPPVRDTDPPFSDRVPRRTRGNDRLQVHNSQGHDRHQSPSPAISAPDRGGSRRCKAIAGHRRIADPDWNWFGLSGTPDRGSSVFPRDRAEHNRHTDKVRSTAPGVRRAVQES